MKNRRIGRILPLEFLDRLRRRSGATISLAAAILLIFLAVNSANAGPDTLFQRLNGDWNGWGWLEFSSGDRERVRCRISFSLNGGNKMSQSLRCASASFKIDATAYMKNSNGAISGVWFEKTYDARGTISGRATSKFMSVSLDGDNISAGMSITSKGICTQSIRIRPSDVDIKIITVGLKRC